MAQAVRVLKPGGSLFIYGSPAKLWICHLKLMAAEEFGLNFMQHIAWVYKQGGDARLTSMTSYSVRMEHLEWFVKPGAAHTFNASAAAEPYTPEEAKEALAKGVGRVTPESIARGRPPRNWWEIARENSRSKERTFGAHPSMKPLRLCERVVAVHSNEGDTVLIPFGGSGSECCAAASANRKVVAYEVSAEYFQIMRRRLAAKQLLPQQEANLLNAVEAAEARAAELQPGAKMPPRCPGHISGSSRAHLGCISRQTRPACRCSATRGTPLGTTACIRMARGGSRR